MKRRILFWCEEFAVHFVYGKKVILTKITKIKKKQKDTSGRQME